MDCPNCKLVNPPTAERCDCGYDFKTRTIKESYLTERDKQLSKPGIVGAALLILVLVRFAARLIVNSRQESSAGQRLFTVLLLVGIAGIWIWIWNRRRTAR
jgi:uncharacterized membrane protein